MKPILSTMIGVTVASILVLTAHAESPEDIATRIMQAQDEQSLSETWSDWHPDAEHKIIVKYGLGQKDDVFTYRVAEDSYLEIPKIAADFGGYKEIGRTETEISSRVEDGVSHVTAMTHVDFDWRGYRGKMLQTDEFVFALYLGGTIIRSLTTIYDFR